MIRKNNYPDVLSTGYQTTPENHTNNGLIETINKSKSRKTKNVFEEIFKTNPDIKTTLDYFAKSHDMENVTYAEIFRKFKKENKERTYEDLSKDISHDMETREILANVDGRLIYWPEPNMLIKIFQRDIQETAFRYSFIDTENETYTDPHESSVLLKSIYKACSNPTFIFKAQNPIFLKFNESFMKEKKLPQASYFFRNSSKTAIRQLQIESTLKNKFTSIFSNLCGFYSSAGFLEIEPDKKDSLGSVVDKMSDGINSKFKIEPKINFSILAKNLYLSKNDLEESTDMPEKNSSE